MCTQLLAAACSTAPLCLLALLLALGWPLIWVRLPVTLLFLSGLHFLCWDLSPKPLVCSGLMTSLLCSYFSLPCMLVDSCSLTALLLFASFIFLPLYSWADDTVVLHGAGPGYSSRPRALAQPLALGRKPRWCRAAPVLGQPCDGSSKQCRDLLFHLASLILTLNTQLRNNGIC